MSGYDVDHANKYLSHRDDITFSDEGFLKAILETGVDGKRILDFGCGDGRLSMHIANAKPARIVGIDASEQMIKEANAQLENSTIGNVEFILADGASLPFEDNSFDLVFSNYVLVAFRDLRAPIQEIWRVLKSGGVFIATLNSADHVDDEVLKKTVPIQLGSDKSMIVHDYLHLEKDVKEILKDVGFSELIYKKEINPDGIVDSNFENASSIKGFHAVFISVVKES